MASHVSEGSGTNATPDEQSVQTPTRRAKVWEHFEQELVEVNGVMKAVCKYCTLKLTNRSTGTNSLINHIAGSCRKISDDERKRFIATMERKPAEGSFIFDPRRTREFMVMWCISAEVPFNKFDDPFFAPLMESLQPLFSGVGHQTMRNDSISRFKRISQELKDELLTLNSRICFTLDLWTSNQKLGYICLTAHYIDANFTLKKTIAFKDVKYPHTGFAIEEAITRCLIEWGIKEKVFTITLDNASNNMSAIYLLRENGASDMIFDGEHLHIRCCAHIKSPSSRWNGSCSWCNR